MQSNIKGIEERDGFKKNSEQMSLKKIYLQANYFQKCYSTQKHGTKQLHLEGM
jgi:hypothetical protein